MHKNFHYQYWFVKIFFPIIIQVLYFNFQSNIVQIYKIPEIHVHSNTPSFFVAANHSVTLTNLGSFSNQVSHIPSQNKSRIEPVSWTTITVANHRKESPGTSDEGKDTYYILINKFFGYPFTKEWKQEKGWYLTVSCGISEAQNSDGLARIFPDPAML